MDTTTEIIELKFDGNGIKPSKVKSSEIAELIISYENAITSIIKAEHPEINEGYIFISLEEIKEGSLSLKYLAHQAKSYVLPALFLITNSFENHNFNQIPNTAIEDLRSIIRFAKKYRCDGSFIQNGKSLATFNQDTEVSYNDAETIKGETTIYGEVQIAGGKKNPRTTIKINDEYTISFEVSKEIAKQLASQLYNEVGLIGIAKWDKRTYKVLEFRVHEVITLNNKSINDTFIELGGMLGDYINQKGDYSNYIS